MSNIKYIDIETFQNLFEEFVSVDSWTKKKQIKKEELNNYLRGIKRVTTSVNKKSKNNLCTNTNTFTILKVPLDKKGKLANYRGSWVLVRCISEGSGWSRYFNEVYLLNFTPNQELNEKLKIRFSLYYIDNIW